ncbi:MAG: SGNH/GDSL hydrolase family protein [Clostridia bacterium]|nr:SGNH/GDSL hydrolase family protein [Clostridia bacterium]
MVDIHYLDEELNELSKKWPENRTVNIVCHGHSVPTGYFATPFVDTLHAYPHLLLKLIKERFPFACVNVIVTAIGGENAVSGEKRFEKEVLCHNPDIITIDYALNDRGIGLEKAKKAWESMIEMALEHKKKVILLTPTWDNSFYDQNENWNLLKAHAEQVRELAKAYNIGLADSFAAWEKRIEETSDLAQYLSHVNHPTKKGHEIVADEIGRYFIAR